MVETKQDLRTKVWWPGNDKAAERYCRSCYECQLVSKPNPPVPLKHTTLPDGPRQDLAVDFMGPLPSGYSLLVIVDYYSRYYQGCHYLLDVKFKDISTTFQGLLYQLKPERFTHFFQNRLYYSALQNLLILKMKNNQ